MRGDTLYWLSPNGVFSGEDGCSAFRLPFVRRLNHSPSAVEALAPIADVHVLDTNHATGGG